MDLSLVEAGCFGLSIPAAFVWALAADLAAMNATFGRRHPTRLWWSIPYALITSVWALASYLPNALMLPDPYHAPTVYALAFDPALWPAYGLVAGTLAAPVVGLAQRATDRRHGDRAA